jgi:hypothetical protein
MLGCDGFYIHPEIYGALDEKQIEWARSGSAAAHEGATDESRRGDEALAKRNRLTFLGERLAAASASFFWKMR